MRELNICQQENMYIWFVAGLPCAVPSPAASLGNAALDSLQLRQVDPETMGKRIDTTGTAC